ncbi:hypothetical protein B0H16DRAFT_1543428 [Mycena metata]|uniref:Uncharacterized protein n=1 Tax=Mycena metata TaxID=1033252 RepID=A0AAD7IZU0_9AGAR|nr:hypothetical protein B0H16DRAFT_1543428 [Mycena metata]
MADISPRRATSVFVLGWAPAIAAISHAARLLKLSVVVPLSHPRFRLKVRHQFFFQMSAHPTGKFVQFLPMAARVNRMCTGLEHRQVAIYHLVHHRSEAQQT